MSTAPVPTPAAEVTPLSEGARIVNTFIAPSKTFTDLRRDASWWVPWLLIAIVSLAFAYVVDRQVGFDQITKNEIAKSSRAEQFEKLPPDQKAKQLQFSTNLTRYISYASPVIALAAFVVIAAVLMGTFNLAAGASVPFKTAMAIAVYGSLPSVFHALLGIIAMMAGGMAGSLDKEAFNIRNPVATNPAYFMDPTVHKFLYGMATALDVFVIGCCVLMGIGFASNSKVKPGTAIGIVLAWYLGYKLLSVGLGAMFS
ncbi:MAG TPA: YIP1 family protein [Terriglobales bacterium]|nr:YIP1 family protein [Terriglobales bacterium]